MITTEEAKFLASGYDGFDEEKKKLAGQALTAHKAAREASGEPLWDPTVKEQRQRTEDVESWFDDSINQVNRLTIPQAKRYDDYYNSIPEPDKVKQSVSIAAYLSDLYGEDVTESYSLYKSDFATNHLKIDDVSDEAVHAGIKAKIADDRIGREWTRQLFTQAGKTAVLGDKSWQEAYAESFEKMKEADGFNPELRDFYRDNFKQVFDDTDKQFSPHRENAQEVFDFLAQEKGVEGIESGADFEEILGRLDASTPEEREAIYSIMRARSDDLGLDKGFFQQTGESIGRGVADVAGGHFRNLKEMDMMDAITRAESGKEMLVPVNGKPENMIHEWRKSRLSGTLPELLTRNRPATESERAIILADAKKLQKRMDIQRELKGVAEGIVDPVKGDNFVTSKIWHPFLRNAAFSAQAFTGPMAMPLLISSTTDFRFAEIMERNPGMDRPEAFKQSMISGVIESPIELISAKLVFGKAPTFSALLSKSGNGIASKVKRAMAVGGIQTIEQNFQEAVQDITPLVIQEISAALNDDFPGTDWGKELNPYFKSRLDTGFAMIPMVLLGTGAATLADFKGGEQYLNDFISLRLAGISDADANKITAETNPNKKLELYKEAYKDRDVGRIKEAETAHNQMLEDLKEYQDHAQTPTIVQNEDGSYTVTGPEGAPLGEANSFGMAATIAADFEDGERSKADPATAEMVDYIEEIQEGGSSIELIEDSKTLQDEIDEGSISEEDAYEAIRVAGMNQGENFSGLTPGQISVFGRNIGEFKDNVFTDVSKIFAGASPFDVIEEHSEGYLKRSIAAGELTYSNIQDWKEGLEADGFAATHGNSERELIEWFSERVNDYAAGRSRELAKDGRMPQSLRGFMERSLEYVRHIMRRAAQMMKLRRDGKLDEGFETALQDALGLSSGGLDAKGREVEAELNLQPLVPTDGTPGGIGSTFALDIARTVETPAFKKWFGDSKVVDKNGEPLVVYHGTHGDFNEFEPGRAGAMYFTEDTTYARSYGSRLVPVYLSIQKLADLTDPSDPGYKLAVKAFNEKGGWAENEEAMDGRSSPDFDPKIDETWEIFDNPDTFIDEDLLAAGYDGFKLNERRAEGIDSYAVLDPTQIKSATGNRGTFDEGNADITYSIRQANFKKWFGDSKVVDDQGKPLVVYHGTNDNLYGEGAFSVFRQSSGGKSGAGIYFTDDPARAGGYAKAKTFTKDRRRVYPVYLSISKPLMSHEDPGGDFREAVAVRLEAKVEGYKNPAAIRPVKDAIRNLRSEQFALWYLDSSMGWIHGLINAGGWNNSEVADAISSEAKTRGYDGIVGKDRYGDTEYIAFEPTQIKSAIGNRGTFDEGNADITYSIRQANNLGIDEKKGTMVKPPEKSVTAYKLFRVDPKQPGKLFPLFVNSTTPVGTGEWIAAEIGEAAPDSKTGKRKVKSKLGPLAFRPGWHGGDLPVATHIGSRAGGPTPTYRPANQVWAEVEMPDDVDWQSKANAAAKKNKNGEVMARTAHITDQLPKGGHYRYKTNPNMTGEWMIAGEMKVNRVLSDAEVESINSAAGVSDLPRASPRVDSIETDITFSIKPKIKAKKPTARQLLPASIYENLTPEERQAVTKQNAQKIIDIFKGLPSASEGAIVAQAGTPKRGWYETSAQALLDVFGKDAPRFAGLLAATSPQTGVESNLRNALATWKNWIAAGRPTGRREILEIMGRSVEGGKGEKSILDAWKNNSVKSLAHDYSTGPLQISGPKVNSFMLNLLGNVEEVTNDTWMANYFGVEQTLFSGADRAGLKGTKGLGYIVVNAKVRQIAKALTKLTGETWTPAEIQETIWSWAKGLAEMPLNGRGLIEILESGELTDDVIGDVVDFFSLFSGKNEFSLILRDAGYGNEIDQLKSSAGSSGSDLQRSDKQFATGEAGSGTLEDRQRHLRRAAFRVQESRRIRSATKRGLGTLARFSGRIAHRVGTREGQEGSIDAHQGIRLVSLSPTVFSRVAKENQASHKFGSSVDVFDPKDYKGYDLIIVGGGDATATVSISPDGEIGAVTKSPAAPKELVDVAFEAAISTGKAKWLDGFDTVLPAMYSQKGFEAVARIAFVEEFAPEGWDFTTYERYNDGRPDVVFMKYTGKKTKYSSVELTIPVIDGDNAFDDAADIAKGIAKPPIDRIFGGGPMSGQVAAKQFEDATFSIGPSKEILDGLKERRVTARIAAANHRGKPFSGELRTRVSGTMYEVMPNKRTVEEAIATIDKGLEWATSLFFNDRGGLHAAVRNVTGMALIEIYNDKGEYDIAFNISMKLGELTTEQGQAVQSLTLLGATLDTPAKAMNFHRGQRQAFAKDILGRDEVEGTKDVAKDVLKEAGKILNDWIRDAIGLKGKRNTRAKAPDASKFPDITFKLAANLEPLLPHASEIMRVHGPEVLEEVLIERYGKKIKPHLNDIKLEAVKVILNATGKKTTKAKVKAEAKKAVKKAANKRFAEKVKERSIGTPEQLRNVMDTLIDKLDEGELTPGEMDTVILQKFHFPDTGPEVNAKIADMAQEIGRNPVNSVYRRQATANLMDYVHDQIKEVDAIDMAWSLWYSNILAGYNTHLRNFGDTGLQVLADTGIDALSLSPVKTFQNLIAAFTGIKDGTSLGWSEARRHFFTGEEVIGRETVSKFGARSVLERRKFNNLMLRVFNRNKYVSRLLIATDGFWFHTSSEIKSRMVALEIARNNGSGNLTDEIETVLGQSEEQIGDFNEQAAREFAKLEPGDTTDSRTRWMQRRVRELQIQSRNGDLLERASEFAARATYNYKPEGLLGVAAEGLGGALHGIKDDTRLDSQGFKGKVQKLHSGAGKFLVPFVRVVANVINKSLDYSPAGIFRAQFETTWTLVNGKPKSIQKSADLRAREMKKGLIGTTAIAALLAMDPDDEDFFQIHGAGPPDFDDQNAKKETGWLPYSIKIGGKYISYKNTPLVFMFAWMAKIHDAKRYTPELLDQQSFINQMTYAMVGGAKMMLDLSFLTTVADVFEIMGRNERAAERGIKRLLGRILSPATALPFSNLWRQLARDTDPTLRDPDGIVAELASAVPIASYLNKPRLNLFGEPIETRPFGWLWSQDSKDEDKRAWRVLAEKQAWPSGTYTLKNRLKAGDYYEYQEVRGAYIKEKVMAMLPRLERSTPEQAQDIMQRISSRGTTLAKNKINFKSKDLRNEENRK